jgi:hypothetical protein
MRAYHARRAPRAARRTPTPTSPRRRSSLRRWSLWRLTYLELPIGGVFVIPPTAFSRPSTTLTSLPHAPTPSLRAAAGARGRPHHHRTPRVQEEARAAHRAHPAQRRLRRAAEAHAERAQEAAQAVQAGRLPECAPPPASPPAPPPPRPAAPPPRRRPQRHRPAARRPAAAPPRRRS